MGEPRFSVLVVGYRSLEYVGGCIGSLLSDPRGDFEVLFLDNASPEPEAKHLRERFGNDPRLRVLESGTNLFFAGGMNRLAREARGDLLMLVNPDSRCEPGFFAAFETHDATRPIQVGMGELRRLDPPHELQSAGIHLDRTGFVHQLPRSAPLERHRVFGANGACFAVRRSIFEQLGGFDESFEMYFEETDFCWRAWLAGFEVEFLPGAVLLHAEGGSSVGSGSDRRQYRFCRNRLASLARNADPLDLPWVLPLHVAGNLALACTWFLSGRRAAAVGTVKGIFAGLLRLVRRGIPARSPRVRDNRDLRMLGVERGFAGRRLPLSHA